MSQTSNFNNISTNGTETIKFLYSYGGRIALRSTDGKLRYVGGYTRVLSVNRYITFADLMVKFGECCGSQSPMNLKCMLPSEDLDVLVSIKSDEDIKSVIEEYNRVSPGTKIKALLFPMNSKKISPPSSPVSSFDFPFVLKPQRKAVPAAAYASPPCAVAAVRYPITTGKHHCYEGRSPMQLLYHVPNWNFCHSH